MEHIKPNFSVTSFTEFCYYSAANGKFSGSSVAKKIMLTLKKLPEYYFDKTVDDLDFNRFNFLVNDFSQSNFGYNEILAHFEHHYNCWNLIKKSNIKPVVCYYKTQHRYENIIRYGLLYRYRNNYVMQLYYFDQELLFVQNKHNPSDLIKVDIINMESFENKENIQIIDYMSYI